MALCSYDEAYTIPTEKAALISLRTMQLLIEEMGIGDTVDPLAGSYYVEKPDQRSKRGSLPKCSAWRMSGGGIVKAVMRVSFKGSGAPSLCV